MPDNNTELPEQNYAAVYGDVEPGGFARVNDPTTQFPEIHRPLAVDYVFPGRGNEPHGLDNDIPTEEMVLEGPYDTEHDGPVWADVVAPNPVPVVIVPDNLRSVVRRSRIVQLISPRLQPTGAFYVPDPATVQAIGADPQRTKAVLYPSYNALGGNAAYHFAISTTQEFSDYFTMPCTSTGAFTVEGTGRFWVAAIPVAAPSTQGNYASLCVRYDTETLLDDTP